MHFENNQIWGCILSAITQERWEIADYLNLFFHMQNASRNVKIWRRYLMSIHFFPLQTTKPSKHAWTTTMAASRVPTLPEGPCASMSWEARCPHKANPSPWLLRPCFSRSHFCLQPSLLFPADPGCPCHNGSGGSFVSQGLVFAVRSFPRESKHILIL